MVNYYEVLGLAPNAPDGEIRKRIHEELRRWNVRANSPSPEKRLEADRILRLLREMEEILLNGEKRAEYDFALRTRQAPDAGHRKPADVSPEELERLLTDGRKLLGEGKAREVADRLSAVSGAFGSRAEAWALLAEALYRAGKTEEAVRMMTRARDLDPGQPAYAWLLGEMFESLERHEQAEELYRSAASSETGRGEGLFRLGRVHVKTGRVREGIRLLEESLKAGGNPDEVKRELFRAYLNSAASSWKAVSPGHPVLPAGRYPMAKAEVKMAEESLRRAESLGVTDSSLLAKLEHLKEEIRNKTGRKFAGSHAVPAAMTAGLGMQAVLHPAPGQWLWFILPILYIISALCPKYLIYRSGVQGESMHSDFARLFDWLKERYGALAWGMILPVYAVVFWFAKWLVIPAIIYNFYRHYLHGEASA